MLFSPATPLDRKALDKAVQRGTVRRIARSVYTDDTGAPELIVQRHLPTILKLAFPNWYISYSTAALLRPVNGSAFISGTPQTRTPAKLPGVVIHRLPALPYPDIVELDLEDLASPSLSAEPQPVRIRISSPLQTVFELLHSNARQPDRSLADQTIRGLIDSLSESDRLRAPAFAKRNGMQRELVRFDKLRSGRVDISAVRRTETLDVFFYQWRIGQLESLAGREYRFSYDDGWTIPLSGLPHRSDGPAYEASGMPAFFDNLLPEGWTEARLQAIHKIARTDEFSLLRTTQKYLSNLTLRPTGFDASRLVLDYRDGRLLDLDPTPDPLPVKEQIGADPDSRELWLELRRRGATRLSGIQPKLPIHLEYNHGKAVLSIGHVSNVSSYILKLPSAEYPELVQNEWTTMELARRIGLPVASLRRVEFSSNSELGSPGLLVERFDLPASLPSPRRIFLIEEAASLLGLRREEKYSVSIERVASALLASGIPAPDIRVFFDHVVFSWIVGNGDMHAKNIAVLRSIEPGNLGGPPTLAETRYSPLYDLVNTRLVIAGDLFALPINGKQNNLRASDFASLARTLGWTRAQAKARIDAVASGVSRELSATLGSSDLSDKMQERYRTIVTGQLASIL